MQKVIGILFLVLILSGCSVFRKVNSDNNLSPDVKDIRNVIESIKYQNITNSDFFIQKAEIEIVNDQGSQKFIATVKFNAPDRFLFSLKSRTGIEGARIYLSKDSVLVNDRLNKKMYFGNTLNIRRKYGIDLSSFPVIFGDLIVDNKTGERKDLCNNDVVRVESNVKGTGLKYTIDCNKRKSVSAQMISESLNRGVEIKYSNFKKSGKILIPGNIDLKNPELGIEIKIKIVKIEIPWSGPVKFIPGKGYELIELL